MSKSTEAFRFNAERLFVTGNVYFWTFTFPDVATVEDASQRWRELVNWFGWFYRKAVFGIRVYEMHPGGHGMHVHALIVGRLDVNAVRLAAERYGFGRIHVKRGDKKAIRYLVKYMTKSKRHDALRGKRVWGIFGRWETKTRVKDIEVQGALSECFKEAKRLGARKFADLCALASTLFREVIAGTRPCEFVRIYA